MTYPEFIAEPLITPVIYAEVSEGHYRVARLFEGFDHLVTFGLVTCKAISLYDRESNIGALVHLDSTTQLKSSLDTVVDAFPSDPHTADIKVVQATVDPDTYDWPTIDAIASYFMQFNPRSLLVDSNRKQQPTRGVALNIKTGELFETAYESEAIRQSRRVRVHSKSLRD